MKIDIVIPNYNGFELIKKNLPILIERVKKYNPGQILIVDDQSNEEEYSQLKAFIEKNKGYIPIRLLRNERNFGFSTTVNKGVAVSNADFITLLNTDVIPENNFLDSALRDMESNDNLFGVGFMDKSIEGDKVVLRGRGIASWKRGIFVHKRGEVEKKDTFWISGGSSIIRKKIFEKIGGFDSLYNPFYWEDIDLSYRAMKAGYEIVFENKSIVEHRHSEGSIKKNYRESKIKAIAYRNQFIFIWKNITDVKLILSHFLWMPYHFARSVIAFDIPFFLGFSWALLRLPGIIKKRLNQKKHSVKRDAELLGQ